MPAVESSNLRSADYESKKRQLIIGFKSGGKYLYEDVPPEVFRDLLAAQSKGQFFLQRIKPAYRHRRMSEAEAEGLTQQDSAGHVLNIWLSWNDAALFSAAL